MYLALWQQMEEVAHSLDQAAMSLHVQVAEDELTAVPQLVH